MNFARKLSYANSEEDSYLCFRLFLLHLLSYFFLLYWSLSLPLCTVLDSVWSNLDESLWINPSDTLSILYQRSQPARICLKKFKELRGFIHYSGVVIILVNRDLYKSIFPTYSLKNLFFCLSVFCISCLFCFDHNVIFINLKHLSN